MKFFSQPTKLVTALALSLTAAISINSYAVAANTTTQTPTAPSMQQSKYDVISFEQRYQKRLARDLAAANAKISATQAVALAQQQVPNSQIMAVQYSDGQHHRFNKNQNATSTQAVPTQNTVRSPSYRIMAIKADGKPQLISVDATTGQVTQSDMQKWTNKANQASKPMAVKSFTAPAISATRAMQLAGDKVGGKVIGVHFGGGKHRGGKHGKNGVARQPNQAPQPNMIAQQINGQQANGQPKDRSYRVKVVKAQEVYMVKVNAQTGEVGNVQSMKDLPKRFASKQAPTK